MLDPAPVDPWLAYSPAPEPWELPRLREYSLVIAVVEEHELPYSLGEARRYTRLVHAPVPDFTWPPLRLLLGLAEEARREAERGGRVLIHCRGGCGRSATVAAAYLILRYGVSSLHAARLLRSIRSCSLENPGQLGVLKALEAGLAAAGSPERLQELLRGNGGEEEKPLLLAAAALHHSGLAAGHDARRLAAAALGLERHPLAESPGRPEPGDAARLGDLELQHQQGPSYTLVARLTGYSETLEHWVEELAGETGRRYQARIEAVIEYH